MIDCKKDSLVGRDGELECSPVAPRVVQVETHGLHRRLAQALEVCEGWQRCGRLGSE